LFSTVEFLPKNERTIALEKDREAQREAEALKAKQEEEKKK